MIAAGGVEFGYPFLLGVMATVNPCGFVLLPTYLLTFLGIEADRPTTQRAALSRALAVAGSVAAGFLAVFLVVGLITTAGATWFLDQSTWFGMITGALLALVGLAMIFGYHLPIGVPRVALGGSDATVGSMFLYGISYAVASLGCTLPLFTGVVLQGAGRGDGWWARSSTTAAYAVGMTVTLGALTVALASARQGLLGVLRTLMRHLDRIAGSCLLLAGVYLVTYWWGAEQGTTSGVTARVERWQSELAGWVQARGWQTLAIVLGGICAVAIAVVVVRREQAPAPPST